MKIPDTSVQAIHEAMERFDNELRNTAEWEKWQEDAAFKYAIEKDGKRYPVKKLISIATGMPVGQFSGGDQANSYIEGYGFKALEINSGVPGIKKSLDLVSNMSLTLDRFITDFAAAIASTDAKRPVACNARSGVPYQCGIGPHTESATIDLVLAEMKADWPERYSRVVREVCYTGNTRQRCDLCIGEDPAWDWCIEVKMLRLMGDNGKPNDNMLMHILSPYPADRSAVTDCEKLAVSGLQGRKAITLFAYEYASYPCEPAVRAFELLASNRAVIGQRITVPFDGLIHPVHRAGYVYGWEVSAS